MSPGTRKDIYVVVAGLYCGVLFLFGFLMLAFSYDPKSSVLVQLFVLGPSTALPLFILFMWSERNGFWASLAATIGEYAITFLLFQRDCQTHGCTTSNVVLIALAPFVAPPVGGLAIVTLFFYGLSKFNVHQVAVEGSGRP